MLYSISEFLAYSNIA